MAATLGARPYGPDAVGARSWAAPTPRSATR